jgi:hypothetical protein
MFRQFESCLEGILGVAALQRQAQRVAYPHGSSYQIDRTWGISPETGHEEGNVKHAPPVTCSTSHAGSSALRPLSNLRAPIHTLSPQPPSEPHLKRTTPDALLPGRGIAYVLRLGAQSYGMIILFSSKDVLDLCLAWPHRRPGDLAAGERASGQEETMCQDIITTALAFLL